MSLPHELLDHILNFLISDYTTLKACAQSHPILSNIADRYIYAHVTLDDDDPNPVQPTQTTSDFAQTLTRKPKIANYVRSLNVYLSDDPSMTSHLNSIASMLSMFAGLTTIELEGNTNNILVPYSWHVLPETFSKAISQILLGQNFKEMYLSKVAFFPLSLLNDCRQIRVTMDECTEIQYDENSIGDLSRPKFEHLYVQSCDDESMEKIAAWVQTRNLRSLGYGVIYGEVGGFNTFLPRLLVACSSSLTNLDLNISDVFHTDLLVSKTSRIEQQSYTPLPFTLVGLSCLEQLTISTRLDLELLTNQTWRHDSPVPGITSLIPTAQASLKRLYLKFIVFTKHRPSPDVAWYPFVPLVAKCSALSITIGVSAGGLIFSGTRRPDQNFPHPVDCPALKSYVEKGVLKYTIG